MAKIIIESNGDTTFRFKKYPDEEFQIKAKIFEIKKIENTSEVYTVKATQANTGELLFSEKISDITVDGAVYTNYEDLSEVLTPLLFKKGGGSGGGGTGDGIVQSILSGSTNVLVNSSDPENPRVTVKGTVPIVYDVTMAQIGSTEDDTTEERKEKLRVWILAQNYNKSPIYFPFWDIVDEPENTSGGGTGDSPFQQTSDGRFTIADPEGFEAFEITQDGFTGINRFTDETKTRILDFILPEIPAVETTSTSTAPSLDKYADINGVEQYGQSLSVGQTEAVITTAALFPNLVNFDGVTRTSAYDKSLTGDTYPTNRRLALVPITERVNDGATATGTLRETPTAGILECLALEINKFSPVTFPTLPMKLLGSAPGWGATTVAQLSKGSTYYAQLIADVTAGKTLANATDKVYKCLAVTWTQGESDYVSSTSSADYKSRLIQLRNDLNTDIKSITGQTDDIAFVMYQTATSNGGGKTYPNIALVQYDLALNTAGFYMATPMYQFKYNDGFHLKAESSKLLGAYYGFVINKIISENVDWKPIHPKSYQIQGNLCKLKFEVLKAPLKFQAANTITLANKGFTVIKGGVDILTSVTIGDDGVSVNLKCSASPVGALIQYGINVTLTPGGTTNSKVNMGNLCDSQGITQKFNIGGTDLPMDNWSPIFEYQI